MDFSVERAREILTRTPRTVASLLDGLSDPWVRSHEGEDTWSPWDVLGHLIHGERTDWIVRARIILEQGCSRPFEPFDRFVQMREPPAESLSDLLETFTRLRAANLEALDELSLTSEQYGLRGVHPEFGEVTLGELLATWAVHDLNHLGQITRVMARQFATEVGPWRRYLSILERTDP